MYAFFLLRGHTIDELLSLSEVEKQFYIATMEAYLESLEGQHG